MKKLKNPMTGWQNSQLLADQRGVAIISALLVLMLLSFVAIISTHTVMTEQRMVRSEAVFEQNFYLAESAAMEGVQKLENKSSPEDLLPKLLSDSSDNKDLLFSANDEDPHNDYENLDLDGDGDFDFEKDVLDEAEDSEVGSNTNRVVAQMPLPPGTSLGLGGSRLYDYRAYGTANANGGRAMIKVGYKKRF